MSKDFKRTLQAEVRDTLCNSGQVKDIADYLAEGYTGGDIEALASSTFDEIREQVTEDIASSYSVNAEYRVDEKLIAQIDVSFKTLNGELLDSPEVFCFEFTFEFTEEESLGIKREGLGVAVTAIIDAIVDTVTGSIICSAKDAVAAKEHEKRVKRVEKLQKRYAEHAVDDDSIAALGKQLVQVIQKLGEDDPLPKTLKFSGAELSLSDEGCLVLKLFPEVPNA